MNKAVIRTGIFSFIFFFIFGLGGLRWWWKSHPGALLPKNTVWQPYVGPEKPAKLKPGERSYTIHESQIVSVFVGTNGWISVTLKDIQK